VAASIETVLGYVTLCGTIERIKSGIPDVLPPAFRTITKPTIGNTGQYMRVFGTRQTARIVQYGSPAQRRDLKGVEAMPVILLHSFEEIQLSPLVYQQLRSLDAYINNQGKEELARQMREFAYYSANLRTAATVSMLFQGNIWFDGGGNLLPTSSGAKITVNYAIPANNQNQLNGILATSWANHAADIPGQIRNLKAQSLRDTGYELKYAFYGANVPSYLAINDYIQPWFVRYPAQNAHYSSTGEIPDGFYGIDKWIPAYKAFYNDNSDASQSFVGANAVTFSPEIDATVYEHLEGTYMVPTTFQPTQNPTNTQADFAQVTGMFAYSVPWHNPPTANVYRGDTFLPIWKVPQSLYQGVCVF
jgi:hypothetical protein